MSTLRERFRAWREQRAEVMCRQCAGYTDAICGYERRADWLAERYDAPDMDPGIAAEIHQLYWLADKERAAKRTHCELEHPGWRDRAIEALEREDVERARRDAGYRP